MRVPSMIAIAVLTTVACDPAGTPGEASGVAMKAGLRPVEAAAFDLEGSAALIRDNRVQNGKELEQALNRSPQNRIDLDKDGRRDQLQVVEERSGDRRTFQVRVIPSSARRRPAQEVAVPVAIIEVAPQGGIAKVTVRYAPGVLGTDLHVIRFDVTIVVGTFCHWVLVVERPVFIGVAYVVVHEHYKQKHRKYKW